MEINVGKQDQQLRVIAGIVILVLGILFKSLWGLIGLVPLLTGLYRHCPGYTLLGKNTCRTEKID